MATQGVTQRSDLRRDSFSAMRAVQLPFAPAAGRAMYVRCQIGVVVFSAERGGSVGVVRRWGRSAAVVSSVLATVAALVAGAPAASASPVAVPEPTAKVDCAVTDPATGVGFGQVDPGWRGRLQLPNKLRLIL